MANALTNLATLYLTGRRLAEAEPLLDRALAVIGGRPVTREPGVAAALHNLATVYASTSRDGEAESDHAAAETMLSRAMAIQEQACGWDSPLLAPMRDNLAELCRLQNCMLEAERLFRGTLPLLDRTAQPSKDATARTPNNLATLLRDQGDARKPNHCTRERLTSREKRKYCGAGRAAMMTNYAILLRSPTGGARRRI